AMFDRVLSINLKGVLFGCQAAGRVMVEQGSGSIINMASGAVDSPAPDIMCYAVAKAGGAQLTRTMALEGGKKGVRGNAVAPGLIITNMTARHYSGPGGEVDEAKRDAVVEMMGKMVPMRRMGQPEDIASAVLYLASDASSYMTGQIL